ncbi:type II toxin-antitoxin system VapB family antitoxin [Ochrobactrum sp. Marseille-Q0166]|uniref:type II toxin-antitoxin system VapB family antitoxin n=1 Tax=Ochrobactrum sp. Marseille-Q0166 TaxID=2761105 RepID=UPI001654EA89|nr:type II toxin-antitoxin system VapB family antitoxin [Ochrobactrum sp. Marseille-Q0166]MBC8719864.1 type II toxin-antitoxin system VapB family antitoxin [Ochrobactrum sp. Marseille-Q0166]
MAINITNDEADKLIRKFAALTGRNLTDAIILAVNEAIDSRVNAETPLETAERLRKKHGMRLTDQARKPLPQSVFNDMWDDN